MKIKISTLEDVKAFVALCEKSAGRVDVTDGHYIVDGKSILGVLSVSLLDRLDVITNDMALRRELAERWG